MAISQIIQNSVATNVAGTGPAFSAYQSSAQTISNSVYTKIQFQSKEFDTNNCFDSTTNYRFTPNVAGYYQVIGCILCGAGWGTGENVLCVYKNGSAFKEVADTATANLYLLSGTTLLYLNGSTDYIELFVYQGSGGSKTMTVSSQLTYFQASMVRAA